MDRPFLIGLAEWAGDRRLRFPDAVLHQARLCFVDTLACMLASRSDPVVSNAADAMIKGGASGRVRSILDDVNLSAPAAALVNGAAAHAGDFDDYEIPSSTHPSAVIVPALLAVSDLKTVTISNLMTAYLVGYEVIVRTGRLLGGYTHYMDGWHSTSTVGPIGAAAATAKLLELPADNFAAALSLAMSTSAGLKVQFGTNAKPIHAGFAARAGLEAALLAQSGITASAVVTDSPYGFVARYGGAPFADANRPLPIDGAPCAMETDPVLRKPWPSCAYTHRSIEAALTLAHAPGFDAGQIEQGTIRIPEPYFRVASFLEPETTAQTRFSVRYCVASALADGAISPESFENPAIERTDVRALMHRIGIDAYDAGPNLEDMSPAAPDTVRVVLTDGSMRVATVADVKGGMNNPLGDDDIREKFASCGGHADLAERLLCGAPDSVFQFSDHASHDEEQVRVTS